MHFFILKENLDKILSVLSRNISPRPQLPILSNILIKTEEGKIKITMTNLDLSIITSIPAKIEKNGETTVPGKLLAEFISTLSADKIEFLLDNTNLMVKTNKTQALFTTMSSSEFPSFPTIPSFKNTFPFKRIKEAITRCVFAASTDEGRPVLTGVKTTLANGKMSLTATDGYRLSREHITLDGGKDELNLILPASSLAELVRITQELKIEEVGFTIIENKNQAVFSLETALVYTRLIDGEFPNTEKIIPTGFKTKVIVEKEGFSQAVKTTSLFARGAANIIKIKIEKDGLRLSANAPQVGQDEDFVEAKVEGEEVEIAFNYRFLLDVLNNFPDENIVIETSGSLSPGVFKPSKPTPSFLHLIMPVRVQG